MSVLPIVTYDDEMLRDEAAPVEQNSEELQQLIDDMFETMYNSEGVGLAAPQVGVLKRVFVADADPLIEEASEDDNPPTPGPVTMINPELTFQSNETIKMDEGCLSIPDIRGAVERPENISVGYLDRDFNRKNVDADSFLARVILHEHDHLDGILFLDHLSMFRRKLLESKLNEIAEGTKDVEYPIVPKKEGVK